MTQRGGPLIVPLDGSEASEVGLQVAIPLAEALAVPVHLLWVYEGLQGLDRGLPQDEAEAADRDEVGRRRKLLSELEQRWLRPVGVESQISVPMGPAADSIIKAAAEAEAMAVIMATHSRGALPRWYMGSVAMEVASTSSTPTILFHEDAEHAPPRAYRRVAVPVELIPGAQAAVDAAAAAAQRLQAQLVLVSLSSSDEEAAAAHSWHTALQARFPELDVRHETRDERLVDALRGAARQVDLLVMPMRDQEGWRRFFSGEEWDDVVREAGVPVMLVRPPAGGEDED